MGPNEVGACKKVLDEAPVPNHKIIDTQNMSKPKIKVIKAKPEQCPLKAGAFFQLQGGVFHVYEVKTRGRLLIKFLGFPEKGEENVESSSPT